jgi:hypothetical protein
MDQPFSASLMNNGTAREEGPDENLLSPVCNSTIVDFDGHTASAHRDRACGRHASGEDRCAA